MKEFAGNVQGDLNRCYYKKFSNVPLKVNTRNIRHSGTTGNFLAQSPLCPAILHNPVFLPSLRVFPAVFFCPKAAFYFLTL